MISHKMLKMTYGTIVKPLQILFDRLLLKAYFLLYGKKAVVMPAPEEPSNYRPISLLSTI